jgi:hypothetical protein
MKEEIKYPMKEHHKFQREVQPCGCERRLDCKGLLLEALDDPPQLHQLLSCQKYGPGSALKQTQHCVSILQPHEVDYPFKNNFGIWSVESYEQWAAAYRFHCLKLVDHIAIKCTPQGGAGEVK